MRHYVWNWPFCDPLTATKFYWGSVPSQINYLPLRLVNHDENLCQHFRQARTVNGHRRLKTLLLSVKKKSHTNKRQSGLTSSTDKEAWSSEKTDQLTSDGEGENPTKPARQRERHSWSRGDNLLARARALSFMMTGTFSFSFIPSHIIPSPNNINKKSWHKPIMHVPRILWRWKNIEASTLPDVVWMPQWYNLQINATTTQHILHVRVYPHPKTSSLLCFKPTWFLGV